jgi:uncharacterized membrane protein YsdA (DUF1294 family)
MERVIFAYFIFINIATFLVYAFDKFRSRAGVSRISERELHTFSLLGGFLGAALSMALLHHKTSKPSFLIRYICIVLIWILGCVYYFTQINKLNFLS